MKHWTPRAQATIGALVIVAVSAFAGGMIVEQALLVRAPATTPVILPERPPAPEGYDYPIPQNYVTSLLRWTDAKGVPVWIAARLFSWESGFNSGYISRRNDNGSLDLGIAALNTYSIPYFQAKFNGGATIDPFDADTSIKIGVLYLASLYEQTGDWARALGQYNSGSADPSRWKPITVRHVKMVLGN